jgi:hypothetical protein
LFAETHRRPVPPLMPAALAILAEYHWPGNVRELRNVAERLVLQCRDGVVNVENLPVETRRAPHQQRGETAVATPQRELSQELFERLVRDGLSFWSEVYEPFMLRDLTQGGPSRHHPPGARAHARQLPDAGENVQHAGRGLQEIPQFPTQVPVPPSIPWVPHGTGVAAAGRRARAGRRCIGMS